jgi:hypothetical protein
MQNLVLCRFWPSQIRPTKHGRGSFVVSVSSFRLDYSRASLYKIMPRPTEQECVFSGQGQQTRQWQSALFVVLRLTGSRAQQTDGGGRPNGQCGAANAPDKIRGWDLGASRHATCVRRVHASNHAAAPLRFAHAAVWMGQPDRTTDEGRSCDLRPASSGCNCNGRRSPSAYNASTKLSESRQTMRQQDVLLIQCVQVLAVASSKSHEKLYFI